MDRGTVCLVELREWWNMANLSIEGDQHILEIETRFPSTDPPWCQDIQADFC